MANQVAIASGMLGVCESMAYSRKAGLDPRRVLDSISTGAAGSWSLQNLAPRMLDGDYAPGFYVKHFLKDLGIALDSARELGLDLPGLELARRLYTRLSEAGHADDGTQALFRLYE
jgi:3-hydroxyisobutyrate dehydrogenase